jgi:sugar/nucleoside kinase (ribokinase family)
MHVEAGAPIDYTAVGHVTIDVLPDGARRPGGTVLYSALQAARLGARARILTRGVPEEVTRLLAPFAEEVEVEVEPAPETTTLATEGSGAARAQRVLAWAGPIEPSTPAAAVVHLAPVARELGGAWPRPAARLVGLTPQGLARSWHGPEEPVALEPCDAGAAALAGRCDALVLGAGERPHCEAAIDAALAAGARVAITDGMQPTTVLIGEQGGAPAGDVVVAVPPAPAPVDDLGAGDVFAAAFFIELSRGAGAADATRFAHAAAAVRVRGAGAGAIGDRDAIERELDRAG